MIVGEMWRRGKFFLRRGRYERELAEEMEQHIALQAAALEESGMTADEARQAAQREFGNKLWLRDRSRDMWGLRWLETLLQDLRFGARMLRRRPGFAIVAILTLALGIGANTAIFSAVNGILLEPLAYAHSSRLVETAGLVSVPEFQAVQKRSTAFEQMALYGGGGGIITGGSLPVFKAGASVTADFFPLLGVQPLLGRYILPGDTQPGAARVAVFSYQLWRDDFGGDPKVLGRRIYVSQKPRTVVGVMPKGFDIGVSWGWVGSGFRGGLWQPWVNSPPTRLERLTFKRPFYRFVARLKRGVSVAQANAQLKLILPPLEAQIPKPYRAPFRGVVNVKDQMVSTARTGLLILFGAVGFVLLLACTNVASLLIARSWTRQGELAIRRSLGATRLRMVRQLLLETLLLALAGGVLGLFAGAWGIHVLRAIAPPYTPRVDRIRLDANVLWFTMGISLLAAILVGLAPALQATSKRAGLGLKGGLSGAFAGAGHGRTHRLRSALVIAEVLLAVIVVAGGALMGRSFYNLMTVSTGVQASHVITMHVQFSEAYCYGNGTKTNCPLAQEGILNHVKSIDGVQEAALAGAPLDGGGYMSGFYVKARQGAWVPGTVAGDPVTPGYFSLMRIPLLEGRYFNSTDLNSGQQIAIVSEGFAKKFLPGDPLGQEIAGYGCRDEHGHRCWVQIVGVVGDVRVRGTGPLGKLLRAGTNQYYMPSYPGDTMFDVLARTSVNPRLIVPAMERVVRSVNDDAVITQVQTVNEIFAQYRATPRFQALLLGSFGALGLLLAIVGVYGVISYSVVQRTHEIGVRMALGAQRADVLGMILKEGMLLAIAGIVLGIGGALALTRVLRNMLFEIKPNDPATFVAVAVALALAAFAACWIPARRAMKVDPVEALRYE